MCIYLALSGRGFEVGEREFEVSLKGCAVRYLSFLLSCIFIEVLSVCGALIFHQAFEVGV